MTIEKTILIKQRKNDWAIQVRIVAGGKESPVTTLATFINRPLGLVMMASAFNAIVQAAMPDYQMIEADLQGIVELKGAGIVVDPATQEGADILSKVG